jgi:hypothetical protein
MQIEARAYKEGSPMSYPDPRYLGDTGEVTAAWRPAGQTPELPMRTATASYLATGAGTNAYPSDLSDARWALIAPHLTALPAP